MICLNTGQTLLFNLGMDFFSVCVLLIVYFNCRKTAGDTQDVRFLRQTQELLLLTLAADIATWLLNGVPGSLARDAGYAANTAYLLFQLMVALEWLRYVHCRLYGSRIRLKLALPAVLLPFLVMGICTVVSLWTGWCFYLDAANFYHRGPLSAPLALVVLGYIIWPSLAALRVRRREMLADRRRECLVLSFFAVPPMIGGFAQLVLYGCSLLWPCVVLSLLLIYINLQNRSISQDALTGLNNRGYLDRYLHICMDGVTDRTPALLMMDINDFKFINDRFGHKVGDDALCRFAGLLKHTFRNSSAFLSRYGGDEFVVVLPDGGIEAGRRAAADLQEALAGFNRSGELPCPLSVSIGCASCPTGTPDGVNTLLKGADREMYREKAEFHRA